MTKAMGFGLGAMLAFHSGCDGDELQDDARFVIIVAPGGTATATFDGEVTNLSAPYRAVFRTSSALTLEAAPLEGWRFLGWSGWSGCTSDQPLVEIPPQASYVQATCEARFEQVGDLVVVVSGEGSGVVRLEDPDDPTALVDPCATADGTCVYERGDATRLRLVAVADPGSKLTQFTSVPSVTCEARDACTVDLEGGKYTFEATFGLAAPTDCKLQGSILDTLQEVRVIAMCDEAATAVQEPSLVEPPYTPPAQTSFAIVQAGAWQRELAVAGAEATLGCEAPGVTCAFVGEPALVDGPHLVVAGELTGPFPTADGEFGQVVVAVTGTGPELPPWVPGTDGASMVVTVSSYQGEAYVDALVGTGGFPDVGPPERAPRVIVEDGRFFALIPLPADADGARILSAHLDEGTVTADVWSAPGLPEWLTAL